MSKNSTTSRKFKTRQLTIVGMLSAISIILGLTGYGFIPLPTAKATIMHIPVIIGAIVEGPIVGMMIGLIFGVFSIIQNITTPTLLSFALINPLVSVLPRVLIALTSYYSYKLIAVKSEVIKSGIAAVIGSLTNTFGVLTMIYLLYAAQYAQKKNINPATVAKAIYAIALTNGVPEAIISFLITVPVVLAVRKTRR